MHDPSAYWVVQAEYDYETARAMLRSRRYLYVLFCCQQAIEKMLKGLIVRKTREFPPRVHSLLKLAETAGLSPDEEQADFMGELSAYYIQSRYPEEMVSAATRITRPIAAQTLSHTGETLQWLKSLLPSESDPKKP